MTPPVPPRGGTGPLEGFQAALKALRERAGDHSFRQMAKRVESRKVHYSTLSRVEEPDRRPTLSAVMAYVEACKGDQAFWKRQYRQLERALLNGCSAEFLPWPGATGSEAQPLQKRSDRIAGLAQAFAAEMRYLRKHSGFTLEQIASRTRHPTSARLLGRPGVAVTTLSDLCNPAHGRVPRKRTVEAFLLALGLGASDREFWLALHETLTGVREGQEEDIVAAVHTARAVRNYRAHYESIRGRLFYKGRAVKTSIPPRHRASPQLTRAAEAAMMRFVDRFEELLPRAKRPWPRIGTPQVQLNETAIRALVQSLQQELRTEIHQAQKQERDLAAMMQDLNRAGRRL